MVREEEGLLRFRRDMRAKIKKEQDEKRELMKQLTALQQVWMQLTSLIATAVTRCCRIEQRD